MPAIVDASIQGKLVHPIIPNVATQNEAPESKGKQAAGISKVTYENSRKIEASKGHPQPSLTGTSLKETMGMVQGKAQKVIAGLKEQGKGLYVSSIG